jgi:metal-sulfur cluster biosynthetic enzyme
MVIPKIISPEIFVNVIDMSISVKITIVSPDTLNIKFSNIFGR